ncbi:MAG: hypothetical protein K9I94_01670 [Bacteroidales bacterium]|nr:hypothetical protein [Bacteroidales bacterium]
MKKYSLFVLLVALITIFIQPGCTEDDLVNPNGNDEDARDKFLGSWLFDEDEATKSELVYYTVEIKVDPGNSARVLLENFGNTGEDYEPPYGYVTESRISIPDQTIGDGWQLEDATGRLVDADKMEWEYTIVVGGDAQSYTATATLQ